MDGDSSRMQHFSKDREIAAEPKNEGEGGGQEGAYIGGAGGGVCGNERRSRGQLGIQLKQLWKEGVCLARRRFVDRVWWVRTADTTSP